MLVVEAECVQFLDHLLKVFYYYNLISATGLEEYYFVVADITVAFTRNLRFEFVCRKEKTFFLNCLQINWVPLVALQLPFECWIVFWKKVSEKQVVASLCKHTKRKSFDIFRCHATVFENGESVLIWKNHVKTTKKSINRQQIAAPISFLNLQSQKNHFFQLPAFYPDNHQNIRLLALLFLGTTNLHPLWRLW